MKRLNVNIELDLKALLPQVKLSKLQLVYCDFVFTRVLALNHKLIPSNFRNFATNLAFIRGHLLKMPLRILLKHSAKKNESLYDRVACWKYRQKKTDQKTIYLKGLL